MTEQTLAELFGQYHDNSDLKHVLLKVVAVNSLYGTRIFAVETVARHIHENYLAIDSGLGSGSLDVVPKIAKVKIGEKVRFNYSFASKYCSWHRQDCYPIWDLMARRYLFALRKQTKFDTFTGNDLWDYSKFCKAIIKFREAFGLSNFSYKQIDEFLWLEGRKLPTRRKTASESVASGSS
jgi:hypothetical protein